MSNNISVCLCMIVKNESNVIARALTSVKPHIDFWVICDTGSTDETQKIILQTMVDVPGELHNVPWVNFGHNRTVAIQLARTKADYVLIMDADMIVNVYGDFKSGLTCDTYHIKYEGPLEYYQPMLLSAHHDWQYVGVTHEYIEAPTATSDDIMTLLTLTHIGDGGMRSDKYERDIRLLTRELEKEEENPRNIFYLAQSYKDIGSPEEALLWYQKRALMNKGWDEERWYANYQAANMMSALDRPWAEILEQYLIPYKARPTRLEPLFKIVQHFRQSENYEMGYLYGALIYPEISSPYDRLFIEKPVYDYLFWLEHGVCSYAIGKISESIDCFNKVLDAPDLPIDTRDAALRGINLSLEILYKPQLNPIEIKNRLVIIVPFYNPGKYFKLCYTSLLSQDYSNFKIIFYNDGSTVESDNQIPVDPKVEYYSNKKNEGLAYTLHTIYTTLCNPDDIIVHVDSDDELTYSSVLTEINTFYNQHNCWVMYGQFEYANGSYGISRPFSSEKDFKRMRDQWKTSHIRTFRAGLYMKIENQDPAFSCMKNKDHKWLRTSVDAATMYPLCELAGFDRVRYNSQIMYRYNNDNAASISNSHREKQAKDFVAIGRKSRFERVNSYLP